MLTLTDVNTFYGPIQALKNAEDQPDTKITCSRNVQQQTPNKFRLANAGHCTGRRASEVLVDQGHFETQAWVRVQGRSPPTRPRPCGRSRGRVRHSAMPGAG